MTATLLVMLLLLPLPLPLPATPAAQARAADARTPIAEGPKPAPPVPVPVPVPAPPAPVAPPERAGVSCKLLTEEAPRGGRLEVEGDAFGKTPVVRIGGRIARLLERSNARIAVQIPRDSDGGPVTVEAKGQQAACGALTIIGKN